jgi:hypothetical protein
MRGDHLLGRSDGGFHARDQRLNARMMGPPLGQTGFDGVAVARLRSRLRYASAFAKASADKTPRQTRFGNIIVFAILVLGPPPPSLARAPPHRFDQKRRGVSEGQRVFHAPSAVSLLSRGGKRTRRHQALSETGIGNNYHDFQIMRRGCRKE